MQGEMRERGHIDWVEVARLIALVVLVLAMLSMVSG
jgi:hypothetical protein